MVVTGDGPAGYNLSVDRPDIVDEGRRYFGGVRIGKSYVSYYLMGVYADPGLAATISPGLRKRMQGKSCFNFAKVDEGLFEELSVLTAGAAASYPEVLDRFQAGRL